MPVATGPHSPITSSARVVWITLAVVAAANCPTRANLFDTYAPQGAITIPGNDGEVRELDVDDTGRLLVIRENGQLLRETRPGSGAFDILGDTPLAPGFNLTFLQLAPDQQRFAMGDFSQIAVCNLALDDCDLFAADHFDAAWIDDRYILLTRSLAGEATVLDTQSPDPSNPEKTTVITGIPGFPAGILLHDAGTLLVGTYTPAEGGIVRAFDQAAWQAAWMTESPISYDTGAPVVHLLSAVALALDADDNLLVGGSHNDQSFAALVEHDVWIAAAAGSGEVDTADTDQVRTFGATDCDIAFYKPLANPVRGELLIRCYGSSQADVWAAPPTAVPAVSTWGLLCLLLGTVVAGSIIVGRARHA